MKLRKALAGLALLGGVLLMGSSLGCAETTPRPTGISPSSASPLSRPLWLPDGSQVVFSRYFQGVFVVDVAGTRLNTIPRNAPIENSFDAGNYSPSLSPDGSQVVYVSILDGDNVHVVSVAMSSADDSWLRKILRFLGFDVRRLTDDGHNINPAWSPDGSLIAYTAYGGLLTLMAASGSEKRVLAPSARSLGYPPVWSPDGSQIAFVGLEGDSKEGFSFPLYIVRPDGSELTRLWDVVSVPTWSPDGSRIAFFLAEEKSAVLYTWDLNGTDLRLLLSVEEANFSRVMHNELLYDTLSWSPDGSALLFASEYVEGHVVSVDDGRILVDLEQGGAAWSPDGARIAVVTRLPTGKTEWIDFREVLYTMARDGTDKRVLVRGTDKVLVAEHGEWRDVSQGIAACAQGYVVPQPRRNPGLVQDCEALIRARDKLVGDKLAGEAYLNWGAAFRIADWQGVTVAGDPSRVRQLSLHPANSPGLNGYLPPELGRLGKLEELYLIGQDLSGTIPPELGNLSELRFLSLGNNRLSGNIPPELGNLAKLEQLDLLNNRLSGNIPPELGNLTALNVLRVSGNELSGCVPASLYGRGVTAIVTDNMLRCK